MAKKQTFDLLVEEVEKNKVKITAQTKKAKDVFKSKGLGKYDNVGGEKKNLHKFLAWAVSHGLSMDTNGIPVVVPQIPRLTKEDLRKVYPNCPDSFLIEVSAIGYSKFKGDNFTGDFKNWSVNDKFTKGKEYPIFPGENGLFAVGNDGKHYKTTPKAWTKIKEY